MILATLTTFPFKGREVIMPARSMRNKLRWQTEKVDQHLVKCQTHLQFLDELAEGQSPYIAENMPIMVTLIEQMRSLVASFRQGL